MSDVSIAGGFDANLPDLNGPIRIVSFADAQAFVCRWSIRDKDRAIKVLLRQMAKARSSAAADVAITDMKRALAARGLLPDQVCD
jgi:hypothetical protein